MAVLSVRIAPLTPETVDAVAGLEQACFSRPWSREAVAGELANPLAAVFTAHLGDRVAGYAGMHHIVDEGYVTNVAVDPACRRRGVAGALLEALLGYARGHGLVLLTLEVRSSNAAAIALYEKYGFLPEGRRRRYYTDPVEDALILTRRLGRPGGPDGP